MRTTLSFLFLGLMASALHADIPSCATNTLANYEETNSPLLPCQNGILDYEYFDFQAYQSSASTTGTPLTASQIDLTPIGTSGQTGVTGFAITGLNKQPITVQENQDVTYVIDWFFQIDAGPIAGGASLGMDPPSGDITVNQYYCLDTFFTSPTYSGSAPICENTLEGNAPTVQTLSVSTDIPNDLTDSITFNPPAHDLAEVMTVIQINGGSEGATFDSLNGSAQIVPAPEPSVLLLIPEGLVLIAFLLRKRLLRQ